MVGETGEKYFKGLSHRLILWSFSNSAMVCDDLLCAGTGRPGHRPPVTTQPVLRSMSGDRSIWNRLQARLDQLIGGEGDVIKTVGGETGVVQGAASMSK